MVSTHLVRKVDLISFYLDSALNRVECERGEQEKRPGCPAGWNSNFPGQEFTLQLLEQYSMQKQINFPWEISEFWAVGKESGERGFGFACE